ncbi:MAG: CHASE2 domain-containing protein, partial [Planktothrix sp.]
GAYLYTAVRRSQARLEEFLDFPGCTGLPIICQNPAEVPPTWEELRGRKPGNLPISESIGINNSKTIYRDLEKQGRDELTHSSVHHSKIVWRKLGRSLAMSLAIALFILSAQWDGKLQTWELQAFDHLMRQIPIEQPDDRLLIVGADAEDLDHYGFPLPDAILAQLIDKLQQYHPSVIGLNILRKKPEKSIHYPGGEQAFVNHLKMNDNLITVCQLGNGLEESYPPLNSNPRKWVGFSDFLPDDFPPQLPTIRRLLLTRDDNKIVTPSYCNSKYSFVFFLAYHYLYQREIPVESVGENWKFGSSWVKPIHIRTVGYQNLDASGNQLLIRYRHTEKPDKIAQQVTVREVLTDSPSFDPGWVKNRIVMIGVTSTVEAGEENTPYGRMSRLHIQAHAVSQILSAVDGDRPFFWWWPQWGNTLWIFIWSLMGSLIVLILKEAFYKWLGIIGAMGILYSVCRFALTQGGWIPLIPAGLALVLSALGLLFYHQIKQSFVIPSKN